MRRLATLALLWSLTIGFAVGVPSTASAQADPEPAPPAVDVPSELPPGFTDGIPVGGGDMAEEELPAPEDEPADDGSEAPEPGEEPGQVETRDDESETTSSEPQVETNGSTRYFGVGPWNAIKQAAAATPKCTGLSSNTLTALVAAPIFGESSAATTPSSAPSPMTLSRWDEWNGTYSTLSNTSANYGLYAFRNPYTSYARAFWHPGIGIWQYDSAGVGAPYTAIERMNVRTVAGDVATGMASRYCNPPSYVVGHGAPFTTQERRDAAWWPWWAGNPNSCPNCQVEYDLMIGSSPDFANVSMVSGISTTGGAQQRTCTLSGSSSPVECWYIDPSVGVIEGASAWATYYLDGKGSPTVAPAPLSRPFYVVKRNGREERHWLRGDTGYDIDISGTRQIGKNARPKSNQSGSGITWSSSSGLCDQDTGNGDCGPVVPPPPPPPPPPTPKVLPAPAGSGLTATLDSVNGTYEPITLDANGDGRSDILWYAPGTRMDYLWMATGGGGFSSSPLPINGTYDITTLRTQTNGRTDLLFTNPSSDIAHLWRSRGNGTFSQSTMPVVPGQVPLVANLERGGQDEIFWYGPGNISDALARWNGSGFSTEARSVGGVYEPLVGDFDNNGLEDIFWYRPGTGSDWLWLSKSAGGYRSQYTPVTGTYEPAVGNFDGAKGSDILWFAPGSAGDSVWFGAGAGKFTGQRFTVNTSYDVEVADLGNDGRDDIVWNAASAGQDLWTRWSAGQGRTSSRISIDGPHRSLVGSFTTAGTDAVFWYAPGGTAETLWWR